MEKDKLCFVGQKAFIEKNGKVLILIHQEKGLDFPGGKIQTTEQDLQQSLKREVFEETGLQIQVQEPFIVWVNKTKNIYLVGFACKYSKGKIKISNEHIGYQWIDAKSTIKVKDPSKYQEYLKVYFNKYMKTKNSNVTL